MTKAFCDLPQLPLEWLTVQRPIPAGNEQGGHAVADHIDQRAAFGDKPVDAQYQHQACCRYHIDRAEGAPAPRTNLNEPPRLSINIEGLIRHENGSCRSYASNEPGGLDQAPALFART